VVIRLFVILSLLILSAPAFAADDEIALLRKQIKEMEARIDRLEAERSKNNLGARLPHPNPLPVGEGSYGKAGTGEGIINTQTTTATQNPSIEYGKGGGLKVTSPDKNFQLSMRGFVQADNRTFLQDTSQSNNNNRFYIRSARPIIEAKFYDNFNGRLMWDLGAEENALLDAHLDYNAADYANIRLGKFKLPLGIERWQSEQNILFVERGLSNNLVPSRDNGVQMYGNIIPHMLEYRIAFTDGSPDTVNATDASDNGQAVTARLFAYPFYNSEIKDLKGLGIGVAGSYGNHQAGVDAPNLAPGYETPAQSIFFNYLPSTFADGSNSRLNPQITFYNESFGFIGEYIINNQNVTSGNNSANLQNTAWEAITSYVLTGENARFEGVIPQNEFDPKNNNWGAFELAARMGYLKVDAKTFPFFASLVTSARNARETTLGGNWYLNQNIKFNINFESTAFDGGATTGDRRTERAVLGRTQFKF